MRYTTKNRKNENILIIGGDDMGSDEKFGLESKMANGYPVSPYTISGTRIDRFAALEDADERFMEHFGVGYEMASMKMAEFHEDLADYITFKELQEKWDERIGNGIIIDNVPYLVKGLLIVKGEYEVLLCNTTSENVCIWLPEKAADEQYFKHRYGEELYKKYYEGDEN